MDNLQFQIIDISSDDIPVGDNYWDKEFIITFYGKTVENKNVVCNVQGFKPFFYLRVPNNWGNTVTRSFLKLTKKFIQSYRPGNAAWKGDYESNIEIVSS